MRLTYAHALPHLLCLLPPASILQSVASFAIPSVSHNRGVGAGTGWSGDSAASPQGKVCHLHLQGSLCPPGRNGMALYHQSVFIGEICQMKPGVLIYRMGVRMHCTPPRPPPPPPHSPNPKQASALCFSSKRIIFGFWNHLISS